MYVQFYTLTLRACVISLRIIIIIIIIINPWTNGGLDETK